MSSDGSDSNALAALCFRCGIDTDYYDYWGTRHPVSEATCLALLRAIGIDIADAADAARALTILVDESWRETTPATHVVLEGGTVQLPLVLPEAHAEDPLHWRLTLESGEVTEGVFVPSALPPDETRNIDGVVLTRRTLKLPALAELGYHRWELVHNPGIDGPTASTLLVVCPLRCYEPPALAGEGRLWGPVIQLYALRSRHNWGIGDFSDLRSAGDFAASAGAAMVGLNPLHALFTEYPEKASPYSPSLRTAFNPLYLDVEAVEDFLECEPARRHVRNPAFQDLLETLRQESLVDYADVSRLKHEVLTMLYRHFRQHHLQTGSARGLAFREFQAAGGDLLRRYALFEALHRHLRRDDPSRWGWPAWPDAYRDPDATTVRSFALKQEADIEYFEYLQWQIALQLASVRAAMRQAGMPLGLYMDLAVGVDPGGAETWAHANWYALDVHVGAPPDEFNPSGQNWGLPPLIPRRLAAAGYAPYIAALRATMRYAGALRIDHVMGLMRLFWVPAGMPSTQGAYVRYPLQDMLGILALESQRNACIVIGEDLGVVPEEIRAAMPRHNLLSYRLLYFEREDDGFKPAEHYSRQALVAVSTHDLPTLRGFWLGDDLADQEKLGLFPSAAVRERMTLQRAQDRVRLPLALEKAGLLPANTAVAAAALAEVGPDFVQAVHAYIARAPAQLLAVQMEDLLGQVEQVNLPCTSEAQRPNWRRKLPVTVEEWAAVPGMGSLLDVLRTARGFTSPPPLPEPASVAEVRPKVPGRQAPPIPHIPHATYRLQFNKGFTFRQARAVVPYLAALGISHVYASPYLKARPGSSHGYDIIDHNAFNPEIGDAEDFAALCEVLRAHGLGQMLDIVPNHMGVLGGDNRWWLDVLENGRASPYASYFDIEWEPLNDELRGKVLLPVLGVQYGDALERGDIRLDFDAATGTFALHYFEHRFLLDPRDYPVVAAAAVEALAARLGLHHPLLTELQSVLTAFSHLPGREAGASMDSAAVAERARDKEIHKARLAELCRRDVEVEPALRAGLAAFDPAAAAGRDRLHELIKRQAYRLAYWRTATDDINYRRFFDINDLAALRMEDEAVFNDTHRLVLQLIAQGDVQALRVDHPDGLYDPAAYFEHLQRTASRKVNDGGGNLDPARPLYLVIEKILVDSERLPEGWPVHGTTGYHFLNQVNGLFVNADNRERMDRVYAGFLGSRPDYATVLREAKLLIMLDALASELNVLASKLTAIAKSDRHTCDFTLNSLRRALVGICLEFPVYRSYVTAAGISMEDRAYIGAAVMEAKQRARGSETSAYDFIASILTGASSAPGERGRRMLEFVHRFQQFTPPVTAKSMEDTAFYIYNRLASLNEVGGDPQRFGVSPADFHAFCAERAAQHPHALNSSETHDCKRGEDTRARINVLSEIPAEWRLCLRRLSAAAQAYRDALGGDSTPSRNDEYLLYQTLLGSWPPDAIGGPAPAEYARRIQAYMLKAAREAKVHTSWTTPSPAYEDALKFFIDGVLSDTVFLAQFAPACRRLARLGAVNSLSQVLLRLTAPGVPDTYQGCELWDFSLVDPDNRRPVDYARRQSVLKEFQALDSAEYGLSQYVSTLFEAWEDGRAKCYTLWRALQFRREQPHLFTTGRYEALEPGGSRSAHVCAFLRRDQSSACAVVVPRLVHGLTDGEAAALGAVWEDTQILLPEGRWHERMSGRHFDVKDKTLMLAELLRDFPVALLSRE